MSRQKVSPKNGKYGRIVRIKDYVINSEGTREIGVVFTIRDLMGLDWCEKISTTQSTWKFSSSNMMVDSLSGKIILIKCFSFPISVIPKVSLSPSWSCYAHERSVERQEITPSGRDDGGEEARSQESIYPKRGMVSEIGDEKMWL